MATALGNIGQDRQVQPWEGSLSEYNLLSPAWDWFVPGNLTDRLFFQEETPAIELEPVAVAPVAPMPLGTPSQSVFQNDGEPPPPPPPTPNVLGAPPTPAVPSRAAVAPMPFNTTVVDSHGVREFSPPAYYAHMANLTPDSAPQPDKPGTPTTPTRGWDAPPTEDKEAPFDPFDFINTPPTLEDLADVPSKALDAVVDVITPDFAIGIGNKEFDEFGARSYGGRDIDLAEVGKSVLDKGPDIVGTVVGQGLPNVPLAGATTTLALDLATGKGNQRSTWGKAAGALVGAPLGPLASGVTSYIGGNFGDQLDIDAALGRGGGFWSSLGNALGFVSDRDYMLGMYGLDDEDITGKTPDPRDQLAFDRADRATGKIYGPGSIVVPVDVDHVGRDGPDYTAPNLGYQTTTGLDGMARGPGFDQYGPPSEDWNNPDDPTDPGHDEGADHEMADDW